MGLSWSRRRYDNYPHNPSPLQPRLPSSSSYTSSDPSSSSYSTPHPPPPPPPSYVFAANAPYPPTQYPYSAPPHSYYQYNTTCGYAGGLNYQPPPPNPYYGAAAANQFNGWHGSRPPLPFPPPPPPYVEHHEAKKVKNLVNVHKDTIKLQVDAANPDSHLLSFTLDAMVNGSITIFYFAKEGVDCVFMPQYPDAHMPVRIPFEKGLGQKFCQPSGSGIDLGFYDVDDLLKPSPGEDVFPLVIFAEACSSVSSATQQLPQPPPTKSNAQITQAVIEKKNEDTFQVKVMKQILWVDGVRYELREIYGIGTSAETGFDDTDPGKECVICMSEPKDTAILPCRHMCLCSECAKELRRQTNKCPICRQPIEELIEIKVNKGDE